MGKVRSVLRAQLAEERHSLVLMVQSIPSTNASQSRHICRAHKLCGGTTSLALESTHASELLRGCCHEILPGAWRIEAHP